MSKEESGVNLVGTYEFKGRSIPVYMSKHGVKDGEVQHVWQVLNPDAFYTGTIWVNNETGEVTYPEGVTPPTPTHEDSEVIPKGIIITKDVIDDKLRERLERELKESYSRRNKKWLEIKGGTHE